MTRTALYTVLVAGMVLLAGCAGGISGTPTGGDGDGAPTAGDTGTVSFYISDEPNAIGDFDHLNVTITAVGFQQAGDGGDVEAEDETVEPETEAPENETVEPEAEAPENETEDELEAAENETDAPDGEADDDDGEAGGWIEYDVDDRTVDLTELRGANATMLDQFDVPNGTYTKVFVYVDAVNATLESGERVNVKLPSEKLHINERFAVEDGSDVDFVFDIAVHEAGNSGKYILKPVISQSGTDVDIERVDDEGEDRGTDGEDEGESEGELQAAFVGSVAPGEDATVEVTRRGEPVENATVAVDGERVGTTDAEGRLTFAVPDGEELEVAVRLGEAEAELEREFEAEREQGGTPADNPAAS